VRTLHGWRRELAGAELLELLGGGASLSVAGSGSDIRVQIEASERATHAPRPGRR
jgi:hypothetical protein